MDLSPRVRAVCDLDVAEVREFAGRHEYDGKTQDLSPAGVRAGLARAQEAQASSGPLPDPHDEAHLSAAEEHQRVTFAQLELHRAITKGLLHKNTVSRKLSRLATRINAL